MEFSVIIPVYNKDRYLEECLQSVLCQKITDYEIILVDDGSTDQSGHICDRFAALYPDKIRVIHKTNEGPLIARIEGVQTAAGRYCLFLDADDSFGDDALSAFHQCINETGTDLILFNLWYRNQDGSIGESDNYHGIRDRILPGTINEDLTILREGILHQNFRCWSMCQKCVKRTCLQTSFPIRDYGFLRYGEDTLQTLFVINKINNYVWLDGCYYIYRIGSGATSSVPFSFCTDFLVVGNIIRDVCGGWSVNIKEEADVYVMINVFTYISKIALASGRRGILRKQLHEITGCDDLYHCLNRAEAFDRSHKLSYINNKMRVCIGLLVRQKYSILLLILAGYRFFYSGKSSS